MEKIIVMVPVECDISVHPSGRIRVHGCINPDFNTIEDQLKVLRKEDAINTKFSLVIGDWVVTHK